MWLEWPQLLHTLWCDLPATTTHCEARSTIRWETGKDGCARFGESQLHLLPWDTVDCVATRPKFLLKGV